MTVHNQETLHAATLRMHASNLDTVTQMLEKSQQVAQLAWLTTTAVVRPKPMRTLGFCVLVSNPNCTRNRPQ